MANRSSPRKKRLSSSASKMTTSASKNLLKTALTKSAQRYVLLPFGNGVRNEAISIIMGVFNKRGGRRGA